MFKQLHYFKSWLLLLLCMVVGVNSAWAQDSEEIASGTFNGKNATYTEGWTTTGTGKNRTDCIVIGSGENITSPTLNLSQYSEVTISIKARRFGTLTGSKATIDAAIGGTSVGTTDASGTNASTQLTDITFEPTSAMTAVNIVFTCTNATSAGSTHGAGINSIVITGTPKTSESPLASISVEGAESTFHVGDEFTHAQAVVTATYEDESTADVTANATFSTPDMTTVGEKEVEVSYTEGEVTKTDTYTINVLAPATLDRIELSGSYPDEFSQGDEFSHEGMMVTAWYDDDTSEDVTANATFSGYDMNTVGEQTVTVTYEGKTEEYTINVVEKKGTENNPYTVTDALAATPASGVYVQGTISSITEVSTQYKNATYTISDGTSEMTIYRGKYLDNADFTSEDQIAVGDIVKVYGNLAVHNNANQMAQGNYIVSLTTKPTPTITFQNGEGEDITELEVSWNETAVLTATCSAGEVELTYSSEDATIADWNGGTVSGLSEGTTNVIVSFAGNDDYKAVTATLPVTVTDTRIDVTLAFTGVPETINLNETATYTVTATPNSTAITNNVTYSSSDDNIVLVDETTGEIAALAAGTATITATFAGNNKYKEATTSYSIKVVDPSAPVEEWVLVDPSELTTGDVVVIVDQTSSKAMGNTGGTSSAPTATEVTLSTAKDKITSEVGEGIQWVVTVSGTDTKTYQFGVADTENYLYTTTSNNGLRVGPSSTNDHNVCGIYDNEGVNFITITDVENKTRYVGVYSSQDWRGYTSINTNIKDCVTAFYKKVATLPVTITTAGAASFSCGYALDFSQVPELTAYKATSKSDSYVHLDEVEQVPAGAGVIVKGAEGTYQVPVATGEVAELDGNLLVGTGENTFTVTSAEYGKVYKYVKTNAGVVGFQKAKVDWTCQAGHAYLMLPTTSAREYLNIFGEEPIDDVATGINSIDNEQLTIDNDAPAYNLAGQKVGKGYKGIVVKNGKKVVK